MLRRLAVLALVLLPSLARAEMIRFYYPPFTGGTITSPILAPAANNCAAVPYSFSGDATTGMCSDASGQVAFYISNIRKAYLNTTLFAAPAFTWLGNSSIFSPSVGVLWQRESGAQEYHWAYSYTDGSNYQGGVLKTSATGIEIAAETAGSGADDLDITLTPAGAGFVKAGKIGSAGTAQIYGSGIPVLDVDSIGAYPQNTDTYSSGYSTLQWTHVYASRSIQGSKTKALTEGAATAVTQIAVPQTAGSNSADAVVQWTVYASDGTDTQTRRGSTYLAAVNKAGTETCTVGDIGTPVVAVSAGTLTCTTSCITGLTDVVQFALDCTSSLTQTSLNAMVRLDMDQPNTVTPQ